MKKTIFVLVLIGFLLLFGGGIVLGYEISNCETKAECWGEIDWLDEKLIANEGLIIIPAEFPQSNIGETNYQAYEYAYTTLNHTEQMAYREIVSSIQKNRGNEHIDMGDYKVICMVDLSEYKLTEDEVVQTYWSVLSDHVEMFYVKGDFCGYVNEEEIILYVLASETDEGRLDPHDVYAILDKYESEVGDGVSNENNLEQKVRYIFDYVMENLAYAQDSKAEAIVNDITSSLACVQDGVGICSGYAKVFTYLCNCVDIPAVYVTGYTDEGYHAWTYVKINELWYACDVTYSDFGNEVFLKGKDVKPQIISGDFHRLYKVEIPVTVCG